MWKLIPSFKIDVIVWKFGEIEGEFAAEFPGFKIDVIVWKLRNDIALRAHA